MCRPNTHFNRALLILRHLPISDYPDTFDLLVHQDARGYVRTHRTLARARCTTSRRGTSTSPRRSVCSSCTEAAVATVTASSTGGRANCGAVQSRNPSVVFSPVRGKAKVMPANSVTGYFVQSNCWLCN